MNTQNLRLMMIVLCLPVLTGELHARMTDLQIYASKFDTVPIAILPFRSTGGGTLTNDEPWKVLADDLEFSGRFKVLRSAKVDSARFVEHGIGIFVDGEYAVKGNTVELDCYLHDVMSMDLVLGKKYRGRKKYVRNMGHRYANQLVEILFGEQGIFETRVLFVKDQGHIKNLHIMDFDGHGRRRLTGTKTVNIFPAFVDSTRIIWTSFLRGKPDLYLGSVASGKSSIFVYSRFVETSPAVSPVVGKVTYASSRPGNLEIYTCNLDKSDVTRLTFKGSVDTSPCWSPTGYQIAFTSDRSGRPQIYIMDVDGANTRRLTFKGKYQDSPSWSPRGDRIAYSSYNEGRYDIWTIKPDGSEPQQITDMTGNSVYPAWSPDGRHLVFANERGNRSDLYMVRGNGTGLRRLTSSGDARMPDWSGF